MHPKEQKTDPGFTLIELLVVIAIIGVFSALAIPGILEIRYRNVLSDSTERFRSAAAATRDLAMQTRRAAVLEVSSTSSSSKAWINLLTTADCGSAIEQRCTTNLGDAAGEIVIIDDDSVSTAAKIVMGGGVVLKLGGSGCDATEDLLATGFALCYSGRGELFYRAAAEPNAACAGSGVLSFIGWRTQSACSAQTAQAVTVNGTDFDLADGAAVIFNRFDSGVALDVARAVVFPTNGAPRSQLALGGSGADTDSI